MQIRRSREQSECEGEAETRTCCVPRSARFFSVSEERDYICLTSSVRKMVQSPCGGQNAVARCWRACTPHGASGLQSCLAKAEFLGAPCNGASTTLRVGVGLRGQAGRACEDELIATCVRSTEALSSQHFSRSVLELPCLRRHQYHVPRQLFIRHAWHLASRLSERCRRAGTHTEGELSRAQGGFAPNHRDGVFPPAPTCF